MSSRAGFISEQVKQRGVVVTLKLLSELSLWLTAHLFPVVVERFLRFGFSGGFTFRMSATASLNGSGLRRPFDLGSREQFFNPAGNPAQFVECGVLHLLQFPLVLP